MADIEKLNTRSKLIKNKSKTTNKNLIASSQKGEIEWFCSSFHQVAIFNVQTTLSARPMHINLSNDKKSTKISTVHLQIEYVCVSSVHCKRTHRSIHPPDSPGKCPLYR